MADKGTVVVQDFKTAWKLASFGDYEGLKALVEAGENVDKQDERGFTPLNWAARNGHQQVLEYLIHQKCSLETSSFGGLGPIHHSTNKNYEKITRMLLAADTEKKIINSVDDNGDTPIHYAAARGVLNIVVALIEAGATIGKTNGQGVTALHKAAIFGQYAVCKKLIETGCDKDAADQDGNTALHYAAKCGFHHIVKTMIELGANKDKKNGQGLSPKEVAATPAIAHIFA
jgi:ankyrin repeat protein